MVDQCFISSITSKTLTISYSNLQSRTIWKWWKFKEGFKAIEVREHNGNFDPKLPTKKDAHRNTLKPADRKMLAWILHVSLSAHLLWGQNNSLARLILMIVELQITNETYTREWFKTSIESHIFIQWNIS